MRVHDPVPRLSSDAASNPPGAGLRYPVRGRGRPVVSGSALGLSPNLAPFLAACRAVLLASQGLCRDGSAGVWDSSNDWRRGRGVDGHECGRACVRRLLRCLRSIRHVLRGTPVPSSPFDRPYVVLGYTVVVLGPLEALRTERPTIVVGRFNDEEA